MPHALALSFSGHCPTSLVYCSQRKLYPLASQCGCSGTKGFMNDQLLQLLPLSLPALSPQPNSHLAHKKLHTHYEAGGVEGDT